MPVYFILEENVSFAICSLKSIACSSESSSLVRNLSSSRRIAVGDFFWFYNHIKEKQQNFNESIMIEFPIILVAPPKKREV